MEKVVDWRENDASDVGSIPFFHFSGIRNQVRLLLGLANPDISLATQSSKMEVLAKRLGCCEDATYVSSNLKNNLRTEASGRNRFAEKKFRHRIRIESKLESFKKQLKN